MPRVPKKIGWLEDFCEFSKKKYKKRKEMATVIQSIPQVFSDQWEEFYEMKNAEVESKPKRQKKENPEKLVQTAIDKVNKAMNAVEDEETKEMLLNSLRSNIDLGSLTDPMSTSSSSSSSHNSSYYHTPSSVNSSTSSIHSATEEVVNELMELNQKLNEYEQEIIAEELPALKVRSILKDISDNVQTVIRKIDFNASNSSSNASSTVSSASSSANKSHPESEDPSSLSEPEEEPENMEEGDEEEDE